MPEGLWQGLISGLVAGVGQGVLQQEERAYQGKQADKKRRLDFLQRAVESGSVKDQDLDVATNILLGTIMPEGKGGKSNQHRSQAKQLLDGVMMPIRLMQRMAGHKQQASPNGSEQQSSTLPEMPQLSSGIHIKTEAERADEAVGLRKKEQEATESVKTQADLARQQSALDWAKTAYANDPEGLKRAEAIIKLGHDPKQYDYYRNPPKIGIVDKLPQNALDLNDKPSRTDASRWQVFDTPQGKRYEPIEARPKTAQERKDQTHIDAIMAKARSQGLEITEDQARDQYLVNVSDLDKLKKQSEELKVQLQQQSLALRRALTPGQKLDIQAARALWLRAQVIGFKGIESTEDWFTSQTETEKARLKDKAIRDAIVLQRPEFEDDPQAVQHVIDLATGKTNDQSVSPKGTSSSTYGPVEYRTLKDGTKVKVRKNFATGRYDKVP